MRKLLICSALAICLLLCTSATTIYYIHEIEGDWESLALAYLDSLDIVSSTTSLTDPPVEEQFLLDSDASNYITGQVLTDLYMHREWQANVPLHISRLVDDLYWSYCLNKCSLSIKIPRSDWKYKVVEYIHRNDLMDLEVFAVIAEDETMMISRLEFGYLIGWLYFNRNAIKNSCTEDEAVLIGLLLEAMANELDDMPSVAQHLYSDE